MQNGDAKGSMLPASVLEQFKYEVASQIGLADDIQNEGWENMSSKDCGKIGGKIGGNMVKVMLQNYKKQQGF